MRRHIDVYSEMVARTVNKQLRVVLLHKSDPKELLHLAAVQFKQASKGFRQRLRKIHPP